MQCREFEQRMNDVLDRRLAPQRDEALLRHAAECLPCCGLLDAQAALFAGLDRLETPSPSAGFAAAVLVQSGGMVRAQAGPGSGRKWLVVLGGVVSIAAAALLAVFIASRTFEGIAARPPAKTSQPNAVPAGETIAVRSKLATESKPAIAKVAPPPRIEPQLSPPEEYKEYRQAINSLAAQFPQAVETIDEVQQATPGMRPIRVSFSMAIGTLQRTIPNRKREQRPMKPDSGFLCPTLGVFV